MKYVEGDLFEGMKTIQDDTVVIAHVCNDEGKMGAGFVLPLQKTFPDAKTAYTEWHRGQTDQEIRANVCPVSSTGPCELGQTQFVQVQAKTVASPRILVANMVAQTLGGDRPLYYNELVHCMEQVFDLHKAAGKLNIICPMFGGALAGGKWEFVSELIKDCWESLAAEVTVYYLPQFVKAEDWKVMGLPTPAIQDKEQ